MMTMLMATAESICFDFCKCSGLVVLVFGSVEGGSKMIEIKIGE
jgi:hypothetical protein